MTDDPFRIRKGIYDEADLEIDLLADTRRKDIPMDLHDGSKLDDSFENTMDALLPDNGVMEGKLKKSRMMDGNPFF